MYRALFKFICIFNLLILICATEHDVTQEKSNIPYDLNRLYRRISSVLSFEGKSPILANDIVFKKLDRDFNLEPLENLFQNSSKCLHDILFTFQSLSNKADLWAWRLLDSFAKPPGSGILLGNFKLVGEYNECINVHAPPKSPGSTTGNFNGQYCTLTYTLPLLNTSFPLSFGICLPDSCSSNDLAAEILQILFKAGGFPVLNETSTVSNHSVSVSCVQKKHHLTTAAISVIVVLSIFGALTLMGSTLTAVKYFKKVFQEDRRSSLVVNAFGEEEVINDPDYRSKQDSVSDDASLLPSQGSNGFLDNCEAFLTCFCLFTNGAKLLNTDASEGQLLCIHGIRFLSMTWVILGHVYIFGVQEIRNLGEIVNIIDDFAFQAIIQGFFSVDSFFVLSGFLLSYLSMKELSRTKGSINWSYFYIHRYLRLTPIYMIILGFSASVYFYLGSGPYWPKVDNDANCQKTWWWNLLYINNFAKSEVCMAWSWYLANDMQFYVISPIFLISLWRWPKIGYGLLGLFLTACILSNFFITYHFDLLVGLAGIDTSKSKDILKLTEQFSEFSEKIYFKPYTRIGPYLVGMITGYILFKHKACNKPKLSWVYLSIGWIVASSVTLTCVYGLYHAHPSLIARSFYNGLNRTLFGCGLSWVIYVCLTNQSNIINSILSFKLFIPLSRLTYVAYLIHPMIVGGYYANMKVPLQFSHPTIVILFLGFLVVTYGLALPVSLILESPLVSLEKLIRNKFKRN